MNNRQLKLYRLILSDILKHSKVMEKEVISLIVPYRFPSFWINESSLYDYKMGSEVILPSYGELYGLNHNDVIQIWTLYRQKMLKIIRHQRKLRQRNQQNSHYQRPNHRMGLKYKNF